MDQIHPSVTCDWYYETHTCPFNWVHILIYTCIHGHLREIWLCHIHGTHMKNHLTRTYNCACGSPIEAYLSYDYQDKEYTTGQR